MKKILYTLLAVAAVLGSCENIDEPGQLGPEQDNQEHVVDSIGKYACRLPVSVENAKSAWLPGDQILIHGELIEDQSLVVLTENCISKDGKTCYVSVDSIAPYKQPGVKSLYSLAYPGELVKNEKQCKDKNTFTNTNALLLVGYQTGETFVLDYMVGGLCFTVEGDIDSYTICGNSEEVLGYESMTSRITENIKQYLLSKSGALTLVEGSVVPDGKTMNHICFPDAPNLEAGFYLTFYKDKTPVKVLYSEKPYEIKRGVFENLGNVTAQLMDYKAPVADTHKSAIPTTDAVNLGAKETANCYVVTAPGVYSFKAVKGNSKESLPSIGSVELVWETYGTTETVKANSVIEAVDFEKDMIYFRVAPNYHPGNALLAAKNDMGVIMWSWHLWLPETEITEELYNLSRRKTMSRNLGALVDATADGASPMSAGLLYQWGRKDPFMAAGNFASKAPAAVSGTAMTLSGGTQLTVAGSIKTPTLFADVNDNWTSDSGMFWDSQKTKYDPCPAGYRVPYGSDYLPTTNDPEDMPGWMFDNSKDVCAFGNPATYYPLAGYLSYSGSYQSVGSGVGVWSSRTASSAKQAYNFRLTADGNGASYSNSTKVKANAYSVRCMSEVTVPFENAEGTPTIGKYTKYNVGYTDSNNKFIYLQELSGICKHIDGSFLWGVGDQGVLAKIAFDGTMEKVWAKGLDLEAITIDPETGDLYMGLEPNYIYKATAASDYKDAKEIFRVTDASDFGNSGVEGISWYKDNMLLVGTQWGAYLWAYSLDGTVVWRKSLSTVAIGLKEIADICYDPIKNQIWIIDSETQSIYLFNGDASEHLATYKVSYGGNCESICLDYANNCVWIADDTEASKLYKVDFTF